MSDDAVLEVMTQATMKEERPLPFYMMRLLMVVSLSAIAGRLWLDAPKAGCDVLKRRMIG